MKQSFDFLDAGNETHFCSWRAEKLRRSAGLTNDPVQIGSLEGPDRSEALTVLNQCKHQNFCIYQVTDPGDPTERSSLKLRAFAKSFGLCIAEDHPLAGDDGVVDLCASSKPSKVGYIPYTNRPLNWHTDGYYNSEGKKIRSFVLHCVRSAADGGNNQIMDPEIAYLRLRDENPEFITALSHPNAMTIPENVEPSGKVRPASCGPVFSLDPETGDLDMRYTARKRSVIWRDDDVTRAAVDFLNSILVSADPHIHTVALEPDQGIICNNCLHNRTGFDSQSATLSVRHLLRARFHNRISGA